ncbi:hypothetical protein RIB2604_00500040 [Aspergillus luchuensis]|uniref:Reverse transcriptase n=1 Tax=Aspergillus kawachii TaxID=1069201 RepID=A0A146EZK4_ASPKA|nr:hypothetical protein RIB2604_00500040 [Aspergillus luchuensis]
MCRYRPRARTRSAGSQQISGPNRWKSTKPAGGGKMKPLWPDDSPTGRRDSSYSRTHNLEADQDETADRLAKEAVGAGKKHPFQHLLSREKAFIRNKIENEWEQEWKTSKNGGHLRRMDQALPACRTRRLYGSLPRNRAYPLAQLRTGHSWLATYAKQHGFRDNEQCECGATETVVHVLIGCPRLRALRQELRRKIGGAFNNISDMLGGAGQGKEGKLGDTAQNGGVLGAVLDFAEASQRFRSRAPRGRQNRTPGNGQHRP